MTGSARPDRPAAARDRSARFVRPNRILAAAEQDRFSVVALLRALVRVPSRPGLDPHPAILAPVARWLRDNGITARVLREGSTPVALTAEVRGAHPGPCWVLDACLDTAPFGDVAAWSRPPTSGAVEDGWLYGRGAADSKAAVAIFCHLAVRLAQTAHRLRGSVVLLFDLDEHTGGFGGAKRYFAGADAPDEVAGVLIGYPGMTKLVTGGRGVYRARLAVHGVAAHSGSRTAAPNAIEKAATLITRLSTTDLPVSAGFPLAPKLTVTAVEGGEGYTSTPDKCTLQVDIRTTPAFDGSAAAALLTETAGRVDRDWPETRPTAIEPGVAWPAYALAEDAALRHAMLTAAGAFGLTVEPTVAGPSNIGNYLAGLGIPATAGFGVTYDGLHGTDERVRVDTIPVVQAVYHVALLRLMAH